MPVEIRELVIRATVNDGQAQNTTGQTASAASAPDVQKIADEIIKKIKRLKER